MRGYFCTDMLPLAAYSVKRCCRRSSVLLMLSQHLKVLLPRINEAYCLRNKPVERIEASDKRSTVLSKIE